MTKERLWHPSIVHKNSFKKIILFSWILQIFAEENQLYFLTHLNPSILIEKAFFSKMNFYDFLKRRGDMLLVDLMIANKSMPFRKKVIEPDQRESTFVRIFDISETPLL